MCRPVARYRSQNTVPSPNADNASADAASISAARSSSRDTTRIPRPPPPADAFTSTGRSDADTSAGVSSARTGTPAAAISFFASIFDPIDEIASTGGPIQVSPASITACANAAFSDRNPYPGCTASAPARRAASTINSARRYVSPGVFPGRCTAASASSTNGIRASAVE